MEAMTTDTANADIRAVFFDIDGTLTSFTTHTVPDSTIEAIHRLQAAGVKVLICTGFFASQALDTADIEVILDWLDRHPDVVCNFGEKDYVYFNQSNDLLRATWSKLGKTAPTRYFEDPRTRALDHETFQISPFVGPELEAELVGLCSNVRGVRWHPDFTDLIPADGGKPRGIQRFMAHYGITREQTMAFGDGGNDTDMLAYAGIGVAMGNATAEPKAAADYITDDVDHDGVRNALLHFRVLRD